MGDVKPTWETIPLPTPWEELTPEQQRAFLAGEIPVVVLSRYDITTMYGMGKRHLTPPVGSANLPPPTQG